MSYTIFSERSLDLGVDPIEEKNESGINKKIYHLDSNKITIIVPQTENGSYAQTRAYIEKNPVKCVIAFCMTDDDDFESIKGQFKESYGDIFNDTPLIVVCIFDDDNEDLTAVLICLDGRMEIYGGSYCDIILQMIEDLE